MTEQPLWRRQQAALAAEQAAPPGVMIQETRDAQAIAARVQAQIRDDALVADLLAPYTIGHGTATPASGGWGVAGITDWTPYYTSPATHPGPCAPAGWIAPDGTKHPPPAALG